MTSAFPVHPYVPWAPSASQQAYLTRPFAALFKDAHLPFEHDATTIPPGHYGPSATGDERIEKLDDGSIVIGRAVKPESIVRFVLDVIVDDPRGDKQGVYQLGKFIDSLDTENMHPNDGMRAKCDDFVWRRKKANKYNTVQTKQTRIGKLWSKMASYKDTMEKHELVDEIDEKAVDKHVFYNMVTAREAILRNEKRVKKEIDFLTSMLE